LHLIEPLSRAKTKVRSNDVDRHVSQKDPAP
jgi:hypothetical protein